MHGACQTSCSTTSVSLVQLRLGRHVHTEYKSEETVVRDKKEEIVKTVKEENGSRVRENVYKHTECFVAFGMTRLEIF